MNGKARRAREKAIGSCSSRNHPRMTTDPGSVTGFEYDRATYRLVANFDSMRSITFFDVPPGVAAALADSANADEALSLHVLRQYAWSESGTAPWNGNEGERGGE